MKCALCKKEVETTFLNKLLGTTVRDSKGKKKAVCQKCQTKGIEEIRKKI